jgi:hypothetical protein
MELTNESVRTLLFTSDLSLTSSLMYRWWVILGG